MKQTISLTVACIVTIITLAIPLQSNAQIIENKTITYDFLEIDKLPSNLKMPDPFKKFDGSRVRSIAEWHSHREYLKKMLMFYLWGTIPPRPDPRELSYKLVSDSSFIIPNSSVLARKLQYKITITRHSKSISFDMAVWRRAAAKRYPTLILNFRKPDNQPYAAEEGLKRGYMFVEYNREQVAPDVLSNENRQQGIFSLYPEYSFCTIGAWAWAVQPVIDVLNSLEILDMDKIIITGQSRGGQTAVVCGILDERIDMVCPSAGSVYADMSFRQRDPHDSNAVDIVERMFSQQPHWHTPRHWDFRGGPFPLNQNKLPFDAPTWFALIAPRPFLALNGVDDPFNNALGSEAGVRTGQLIYKWMDAEQWCRIHWRDTTNKYGQIGHNQGPEEFNAIFDYADEYFFKKPKGPSSYNVGPKSNKWLYDPAKYPLLIDWEVPSK